MFVIEFESSTFATKLEVGLEEPQGACLPEGTSIESYDLNSS
jgi:hypothetical protein